MELLARHPRVEPLASPTEVAQLLGISRRGVYRLVSAGDLRAVKVGNQLRVEASELRRFLDEHRMSP